MVLCGVCTYMQLDVFQIWILPPQSIIVFLDMYT